MQTEKQRERLVELLTEFNNNITVRCPKYDEPTCEGCEYDLGAECDKTSILADYLMSNNVVVLPCKVGQVLWFPSEYYNKPYSIFITKAEIYEDETIMYSEGGTEWYDEDIGKTVFLSREETENVLKERKENGK